ncbi:MAG: cupredoxin family protein [Candidatus Obscuribacterales bacterium]|nr:cupredoxin family protein [Candidatus Obscuribacterales bacterium]
MKTRNTLLKSIGLLLITGAIAWAGPGQKGHSHSHHGETEYGEPGDKSKPSRTIVVQMQESGTKMIFIPDVFTIRKGEQIKFVLRNVGAIEHEFVLGTKDEIEAHAEQMRKNPDMEHDDPQSKRLKAKENGEIYWKFTKAGEFEFACLIPGHREQGMHGKIFVK